MRLVVDAQLPKSALQANRFVELSRDRLIVHG